MDERPGHFADDLADGFGFVESGDDDGDLRHLERKPKNLADLHWFDPEAEGNLLDTFSQVIAFEDGVCSHAGVLEDRSSGDLARNDLDLFAACPVHVAFPLGGSK